MLGLFKRGSLTRETSVATSTTSFFQPPQDKASVTVRACERRLGASVAALSFEYRPNGGNWLPVLDEAIDKILGVPFTQMLNVATRSYTGFGFVAFGWQNGLLVFDPTECGLTLDAVGRVMDLQVTGSRIAPFAVAVQRGFGAQKVYSPREVLADHIDAENSMVTAAKGLSKTNGIKAVVVQAPNTNTTAKEAIQKSLISAMSGEAKTAVVVLDDAGGATPISVVGGDVRDVLSQGTLQALQGLVANEFLVPRDLIDPQDSNRATSDTALTVYNTQTVIPIAWALCETLNKFAPFVGAVGQLRPKELQNANT